MTGSAVRPGGAAVRVPGTRWSPARPAATYGSHLMEATPCNEDRPDRHVPKTDRAAGRRPTRSCGGRRRRDAQAADRPDREAAGADLADARDNRLGSRPDVQVKQGSEVDVHVTNDGDLDTTVHWHGTRWRTVRRGSHETQTPIRSAAPSPTPAFPDPAVWYHPIPGGLHPGTRLYGNILGSRPSPVLAAGHRD